MCYLVSVIAGGIPKEFLLAIRAAADFRYSQQASCFSEESAVRVQLALEEFHEAKQSILDAGTCLGSNGDTLDHWQIPKLEFMQAVYPSILASGPIVQWSAEPTEHAHITEIKDPARSGNNKSLEEGICHTLDLQARLCDFDLNISIKDWHVRFDITQTPSDIDDEENREPYPNESSNKDEDEDEDEDNATIVSTTRDLQTALDASLISKKIWGATCPKQIFFLKAERVKADLNALKPYWVFSDPSGTCAAMRVTRDPDLKTLSIEEAAAKFSLPGLQGGIEGLSWTIFKWY